MSTHTNLVHVRSFFSNIYLFIPGCTGSSLLCSGFLELQQAGPLSSCGARDFHCGGFPRCGAQALSFSSCSMWAQQLQLTGTRAQAL